MSRTTKQEQQTGAGTVVGEMIFLSAFFFLLLLLFFCLCVHLFSFWTFHSSVLLLSGLAVREHIKRLTNIYENRHSVINVNSVSSSFWQFVCIHFWLFWV